MNSMQTILKTFVTIGALTVCVSRAEAQQTTVIRAATILDGRGGSVANGAIVIRDGRIVQVDRADAAPAGNVVYDLGSATVMPGLIDGHVHVNSYINAKGRFHSRDDGDTPAQSTLAIAHLLRDMLWSGVTTVQSMGSNEETAFREAVANGSIVGPRILTTLNPISNEQLSPDSLRALVRNRKEQGADAIKVFASKSIRDGGATTMSAAQLSAICGEAKSLGLRTLVHAHSAESMRFAAEAGCTQIEHGVFATPEVLKIMADRGTLYDPQCGLVFRNYLDNRAKFEGIGNFNEEGFASMQRAIPMAANVVHTASVTPGLKLVWGTDAVAGAHGHNVDDLICRVKDGGQSAAAALASATSGGAEGVGLGKEIGVLAPGYRADIIALAGNPMQDITALKHVMFVMRDGVVYRTDGAARITSR